MDVVFAAEPYTRATSFCIPFLPLLSVLSCAGKKGDVDLIKPTVSMK